MWMIGSRIFLKEACKIKCSFPFFFFFFFTDSQSSFKEHQNKEQETEKSGFLSRKEKAAHLKWQALVQNYQRCYKQV